MTPYGIGQGASEDDAPEHMPDPEDLLWLDMAAGQALATAARERIFMRYLPYAKALAARLYRGRPYDDVEFSDFYQLACVGLLEAIDRYDATRGVSFKTFCTLRVEGNVLSGVELLTDGQEQVRLARRIKKDRLASLKEGGDEGHSRASGAFAKLCEVATGLAIGFMLDDTSMFAGADERQNQVGAYHTVAWRQAKARLMMNLERLPERERKILMYHYFHGLTFEHIGSILGVTKGRISQIHRSALALLRQAMGDIDTVGMVR
ncbi:sigma-70 family RNA polymerase sigma factor [Paraherbaspirillum soli]|uniref:Sigma-70 family RNA polymerase sigma factor n=1 Tax=Paraherbaspirillum soli TaxID=631222 RepID=A0ABW0MD27_9BURK